MKKEFKKYKNKNMLKNKKLILATLLSTTILIGQNFHQKTIELENAQRDSLTHQAIGQQITTKSLEEHIIVLASDSLRGREVGTEGEILAAEYISSFYKQIGIPPYRDSTYYQEFELGSRKFKNTEITINNNTYVFGSDFYSYPKFGNTNLQGQGSVFLGYGIETERYSDYNIDVENKIVVVLEGEPVDEDGNFLTTGTTQSSPKSNYREKLKIAQKNKASAVFFIKENIPSSYNKAKHRIEHPGVFLLQKEDPLPFFYISEEMAKNLFTAKKKKKTKEKIQKNKKTKPINTTKYTTIKTENEENYFYGKNVLGYIEGSDPSLKDELIIITAHYDHIGIIDGKIHNGADDNASGTAAVLEIAKSFQEAKKQGISFKRSVLCMPVSAEEKGLLGSYYYAENPEFPLQNTIANLNIDMIGRMDEFHSNNDNYIYLIGSDKLSTDLHNISEHANQKYSNIELDYTFNDPNDPNRFYYRSDHYNFAKNNIPAIFYFSGVHEDYHKHTDTIEKLNYNKITKVARLVFYTAWELSNAENRPRVDKINAFD